MSTTSTENPSYRNAITENTPIEVAAATSRLKFVDYQELTVPPIKRPTKLSSGKRDFLIDIMEPFGNLTQEVNEYYGFHNIANTLTLGDVLDCLEISAKVDIAADYDFDGPSEEEE